MSETEVVIVSETEVAKVNCKKQGWQCCSVRNRGYSVRNRGGSAAVSETPETLTAAFPSPSPSLLSLQAGSGAAAALKVKHS